ncbi:hypothetical protein LCGC14_2117800, partial [marine sediment metagenome]
GPLVNTAGDIVGINTRAMFFGGDMGFAIPATTIRFIVAQLRKFKKVNWSWTGLQLQPLKDFRKNIYFEGNEGVIVAETDPESPARRAGIRVRDRILRVNGRPITAMWEEDLPAVRKTLGLLEKDKPARIELRRNGKTLTVELTPREKGKVEGEELDCPRWDMTVKAINQFDNEDLYFYRKKGIFVFGVKYPGNAINAKLQIEDIILRIGDKEVETLEDVKHRGVSMIVYPDKGDLLKASRYIVEIEKGRITAFAKIKRNIDGVEDLIHRANLEKKLLGKTPPECTLVDNLGEPLRTLRSRERSQTVRIYDIRHWSDFMGARYCVLRFDDNERCRDVTLFGVSATTKKDPARRQEGSTQ